MKKITILIIILITTSLTGCFGETNTPNEWKTDEGVDTDMDGLDDYEEFWKGTDPLLSDTDGDGMPDGWEVAHGLDPLDPSDADLDNDMDNFSNLEEFVNMTNPNDPDIDRDGEIDNDFIGSIIIETPGSSILDGVAVPYIYYENEIFYLYMCNGTEGHHYSTSNDGLNFTSPLKTGIGGCGLNFVKLNNGSYRLYTTTKVTLEDGTESINSTSALFSNLTNIGPTNRIKDNGTNAEAKGEPCNNFMGTPNVIRLNENDDSVRLYFSCSDPSHMASFTSLDGFNFGESDGILLNQAIDIEVHNIGDKYRVFYTLFNPESHPEISPFHPQEIMTAVSDDGLNWTVEGMIANVSSVSEKLEIEINVLADPTAVQLSDGSWRIYFGSASEKTDDHGGIYSLRWIP